MVSAKAGYYRPSSANTLVLTKAGDQIPTSWAYIGPTNPTNWPVTVFASPTAPPTASTIATVAPTFVAPPAETSGTTAVVPKVSDGSVYVTPSGTYVQTANTGLQVADSWQQVSVVPPGSSVVVDPLVGTGFTSPPGSDSRTSSGQVYITDNGTYLAVPAGQQVPTGWVDTTAANIDTTGKTILQAPDGNAVAKSAAFTRLITGILAIGGASYLAYLGYQVIKDPESVISTLKRMNMFRDLLSDAAQISGFLLVLAAAGFAAYEFTSSFVANDFSISSTIADLVSSSLVVVLEACVESVVDFWKKVAEAIANAFKGAIF